MKKLLFILFFFPLIVSAQTNTISIILQPVDLGLGLRYDKMLSSTGIYSSVAYGNYYIDDYKAIKNHIKVTAGFTKYLPNKLNGHPLSYLSVGLNYNYYGDVLGYFSERTLQPVSIDLGAGMRFKKVMTGFMYDPIKHESILHFGVNF